MTYARNVAVVGLLFGARRSALPTPPRLGALTTLLAAGTAAARAEAIFCLLRSAVALAGAATLVVTTAEPQAARTPLIVAAWLHVALGVASLAAVVPLTRLTTDSATRRAACVATALDVAIYAAYTIAFASHAGAGTTYGIFVLLIGPVRWGWRGALVTGLPVGIVASLWPQQDVTGDTIGIAQTWLLIVLFAALIAAIATLTRRAGARLRQAQEQFRAAFEHASIGMALLDEDLALLQVNRSLAQLLGSAESELFGTRLDLHVVPDDQQLLRAALAELSAARPATRLEVRLVRPDGLPRWGLVAASWLAGSPGVPPRVVLQIENITDRKEAETRLSHLATHDGLTRLPNRALLRSRMESALDRNDRLGVLFLDLDRFKLINDSIGHAAGDEMLVEIGRRIADVLGENGVVARFGGDEFAILVDPLAGAAESEALAARILQALGKPLVIGGRELFPSASIGIALWQPRYRLGEELLRDADAAMYRAKAEGRDRCALFDEGMRAHAIRLLDLEADLRRAILANAFVPHFQPIVRLADGVIVGHEALLRWSHDLHGPLPPGEFVGVGEDSGLIEQIDWLLYERVVAWLRSNPDGYVSINVSPRHFHCDDFAERLLRMIDHAGADPRRLRIEITEVALLDDAPRALRMLNALRGRGVLALLDDFGTGFSALSYLHRFPIQALKIDRSFVAGLDGETRAESLALVRAILALAGTLGIDTIGEGIETPLQRDTLAELGCLFGQGYLLGKPGAQAASPGAPPTLQ